MTNTHHSKWEETIIELAEKYGGLVSAGAEQPISEEQTDEAKNKLLTYFASQRQEAVEEYKREIVGKIETLWQYTPPGGIIDIVMEGKLVSRKQVLSIINTGK